MLSLIVCIGLKLKYVKKFFKLSARLLITSTVSAYSSFGYYMGLMGGQNTLIDRLVSELIDNKSTKHKLRSLHEKSQKMRDFASKVVYQAEYDCCRHYADLNRHYEVWNMIEVKEFSLE